MTAKSRALTARSERRLEDSKWEYYRLRKQEKLELLEKQVYSQVTLKPYTLENRKAAISRLKQGVRE